MKWPATRITESSPKSFGMYEKAVVLMEQGIDIIHLEVGRPSFDTPEHIKAATKKALDDGRVHYGDFLGELDLREALSRKLAQANKIDAAPDEILMVNGLTHGAYATCMAAIDPGDEVIILEPYYPQHINKIELAGGKVVTAPLNKASGFTIDKAAIEQRITPSTKMIALVNPANPTGRAFNLSELEALAEIAIKHDLLVMSDEVYEQILYNNNRHISIASLPGMKNRTISLFAFTKAYAMDGWRMGYAVAEQRFIRGLLEITTNDVAHLNVFIQAGALAAVSESQQCIEMMLAEDHRRMEMVCSRLNAMSGIRCPQPEATIYAFPDVSALGQPTQELADEILVETHVAVEAGTFYGSGGEGHLRICFGAESYERISEAMDRLEAFFIAKSNQHNQAL